MIEINNKVIEEKIHQLKKAIEIIGGKESVVGTTSVDIAEEIISATFNDKIFKLEINNKEYSVEDLFAIKVEYEKYLLKNKGKTLQGIIYKIKKYDTSLDSLIRKYKKSGSIEEYNKIYNAIGKNYRRDINSLILKGIDTDDAENLLVEDDSRYYGEYLTQKKKSIVDNVISKMGIV